MKAVLTTQILLVFILVACRGADEPNPLYAPGFRAPVVSGIVITGERGPDPVAVWGQPTGSNINSGGNPPAALALYYPYPNPSNQRIRIEFGIPAEANVSVWIVPAVFGGPVDEVISFGNATLSSAGGLSIRTLLRDQELPVGVHLARWDGRDDFGRNVGSGFYRVFLRTGDSHLWQDIFLARHPCDMPPSMIKLVPDAETGCN